MFNPNLIAIYLAVTAVAVLIQTGIAAGLYFTTLKITQQADKAVAQAEQFVEPVHRIVGALEAASVNLAAFTSSAVGNLRQIENDVDQNLIRFRRKLG